MTLGALPPPEPQAAAAAETTPVALVWRHLVAPVPVLEMTRAEVEARVETFRKVVVALVLVLLTVVKLVMIEVALLTRIPPGIVMSPVEEIVNLGVRVVRESFNVPMTNEPAVDEA